jgi:hypothetical protein
MAESYTTSCKTKSTLSTNYTILQTLQKLKEEIQEAKPSLATQQFQTDITFVEQEYNGIPDVVTAYEAVYPGFKQSGTQYNTAECQWNEIKKWDDNSKLQNGIKQVIQTLREERYRDGTEEGLDNTHPKRILEEKKLAFRSIKSCYAQRQEEEEDIVEKYNKIKAFKETAQGWFVNLQSFHEQAKNHNDKKQYRALHAVYLEAYQVWQRIQGLPSETPAMFKKKLTDALWKVLKAKDERFRWHQYWLCKEEEVIHAQENYDAFAANRLKDFIREAEDVEAAYGETENGETGNGAGEGPVTYGPSTPAERY